MVLKFVGRVGRRQSERIVVEYFVRLEETVDFDDRVFGRIRCVYYVFLTTHAKVAPDSARFGFPAVCGAGHGTDHGNSVAAFETHYNYRSSHHRAYERRKERTVDQVGIMLTKDFFVELHHFDACDDKSFFLKPVDDLSDKRTLDCRWFENYKSLLHYKYVNKLCTCLKVSHFFGEGQGD